MDDKHQSIIEQSWQRCRQSGLSHSSNPTVELETGYLFNQALDEHSGLIKTTHHKVLPFYDSLLANSNCLITLTDTNGLVLKNWGEQRFFSKHQPDVFQNGAHWRESLIGTNAIGTALETGSIVQVFRDEHFLTSNRFMMGSAAPLFDSERKMAGVLSISSDAYMPTSHTLGMVKLMSQAIENQLIASQFQDDQYLLWFNTSPENIDSQWSSLLVFNEDGVIISANRRAEITLGQGLALQRLDQLFDVKLTQVLSHPHYNPMSLVSHSKHNFFAIVTPPKMPVGRKIDYRIPTKKPSNTRPKVPIELDKLNMGDPRLAKAISQASRLLNTDIPILIHGETGVGKEVFVNALHLASDRKHAPMIAVNCAAIPADLVESELFGYEKGAFTGANQKGYIGLIRKADKGTLFLDEIGDMPMNVQARLLRVLQERQVTPLGSTTSYPVNFKLVSATHCHLKNNVEQGTFRQDLYYRVTGLNITLPPLRERTDKVVLIEHLLSTFSLDDQQPKLNREVLEMFTSHPWPGNIRQMVSVIQIALAMAGTETVTADHLPDDFLLDAEYQSTPPSILAVDSNETYQCIRSSNTRPAEANTSITKNSVTDAVVTDALGIDALGKRNELVTGASTMIDNAQWLNVYEQHGRNVSATAKQLNISRNTLYKRLREQGLR
ncbi:sigma-54-dependent Fis family transcriptional regulator [Vibrio genomosp. F10]|uniref:Fis family transcriptional regulator n=1 Tax=Vibrio genomosp. F10 TaxID=723171 RepID=A0A1B9QXJ2_9VIBR|nr:sigma-54-dependent Fis family transcriptional regulator [Vibrio genomosp. F10]OCH74801.1 Fis family transcriptional regulator [Vibrio genomosp. F10]